jgi:hypothetical protein
VRCKGSCMDEERQGTKHTRRKSAMRADKGPPDYSLPPPPPHVLLLLLLMLIAPRALASPLALQ